MKVKRIMFLHHIVTPQDDALIKRAFRAQVSQPVKGDWVIVVKEDMEYIGLGHLTFDDVARLSKIASKDCENESQRHSMERTHGSKEEEQQTGISEI